MKVLIVDRCADSTLLLERLLESHGHDTQSAKDASSAVEAACRWRPDVVFFEIESTGQSGYVLARRLRSEGGLTSALLVAQSGYLDDDDRRRESDIDVYLLKPASTEQVCRIIPAWQKRQRTSAMYHQGDSNRDLSRHAAELAK